MDIPTPSPLKENKLGAENDDSYAPEEQGIPENNKPEMPSSPEFIDLSYKDFNIKIGSSRFDAVQLSDLSYSLFNLITKGGPKDESKTKSYLS